MFNNDSQKYSLVWAACCIIFICSLAWTISGAGKMLLWEYVKEGYLNKYASNEAYLEKYQYNKPERYERLKALKPEILEQTREHEKQIYLQRKHSDLATDLISSISWLIVSGGFLLLRCMICKRKVDEQ